jgi:hypothetical protein
MMLRSLSMTLALLLPLTGYAKIQAAPTVGYTGLNFTVAGGTPIGYQATCTALSLDANGDISGTRRFAAYGVFNCGNANEAYSVIGSGYLTTVSTVNMTLNVGIFLWVCTLSSTTFNGSCSVITYTGDALGTLTLTFVP